MADFDLALQKARIGLTVDGRLLLELAQPQFSLPTFRAGRQPLLDKVTIELASGDAVQILTPAGGGYGPPGRPTPMTGQRSSRT